MTINNYDSFVDFNDTFFTYERTVLIKNDKFFLSILSPEKLRIETIYFTNREFFNVNHFWIIPSRI